jgi:AcrR family transcriptional regulator
MVLSPSTRSVRLAGEDVPDHHVALLADGPDEVYDVLLPFIVDGFAQGDRAIHVVDPALYDRHLERINEAGIDVPAAIASHQLLVETWNEAYLVGGSFDRHAQYAYIREHLKEGAALGFPVTRLVGSLDWAADDPDLMSDVVAYERAVDVLMGTLRDVVVCTYDLRRHSARTIADVLGVHPAAIVAGVARSSHRAAPVAARDRLLAAASRLFHEVGIRAAGVDSIIREAGVAKATFYRHFPSKDDLIVAWLRDPRSRWLDRVRTTAEVGGPTPAVVIPRFFDALAEWLEAGDYRGCPYLNTAVEVTDPSHPARDVITAYLEEIEAYFTGLAGAAGCREPGLVGRQILTLVAGSIQLAVARRGVGHVPDARDAAVALLRAAERA